MNPYEKAKMAGVEDAAEFIRESSKDDLVASVSPGCVAPDEALLCALGVEATGRMFGVRAYNARGVLSAEMRRALRCYNTAYNKTVKAAIK